MQSALVCLRRSHPTACKVSLGLPPVITVDVAVPVVVVSVGVGLSVAVSVGPEVVVAVLGSGEES